MSCNGVLFFISIIHYFLYIETRTAKVCGLHRFCCFHHYTLTRLLSLHGVTESKYFRITHDFCLSF